MLSGVRSHSQLSQLLSMLWYQAWASIPTGLGHKLLLAKERLVSTLHLISVTLFFVLQFGATLSTNLSNLIVLMFILTSQARARTTWCLALDTQPAQTRTRFSPGFPTSWPHDNHGRLVPSEFLATSSCLCWAGSKHEEPFGADKKVASMHVFFLHQTPCFLALMTH